MVSVLLQQLILFTFKVSLPTSEAVDTVVSSLVDLNDSIDVTVTEYVTVAVSV
jgi:hypothetical protein